MTSDELMKEARKVINFLLKLYNDAIVLASNLENREARSYFGRGLAQRLRMIYTGFKYIASIAPAERSMPLNDEEANDAMLHINSLYIHLYGALDNVAWTIALELNFFRGDKYKKEINLYKSNYIEQIKKYDESFSSFLSNQTKWYWDDFSEKRHPSAHRLPLYIPSAAYESKNEIINYNKLNKKIWNHHQGKNIDNATKKRIIDKMDRMGRFIPYFANNNNFFPLYPTVTIDCKNVAMVVDEAIYFLETLIINRTSSD